MKSTAALPSKSGCRIVGRMASKEPFAPACSFIAGEIIEASAGVGVDHTECCRLPTQVVQDATKNGMLEHIGEIASVEFVLIIHDRNLPKR